MSEELRILRLMEGRWEQRLRDIENTEDSLERTALVGRGLVGFLAPLYCHPQSKYFRSSALLPWLEQGVECLLADQLESGCISLLNCNIDSPPDTAFQTHGISIVYHVLIRSGLEEVKPFIDGILLFLERAKPCLLRGGIHTPNHRWVMCGALANMYEIFGDEAFRERAEQYLVEGFDITEYGEWTERSNAMYNSALAIHLIDVGEVFGHEAAYDAVRRNLRMMRHMFHSDGHIATEYSGRQDLAQQAKLNDWYYTSLHLMAAKDQDPELAALARFAEETAVVGGNALMYWMLYPERMALSDVAIEPMPGSYTVFLGEGNRVPVPQNIPYVGMLVQHPHGAPLVRHRRGKLSVTFMSGQRELLYVQYGQARMVGYKLGLGWFGIGSAAFPSMEQVSENRYRMHIELEGCYFDPLPPEKVNGLNGVYVDMPNKERPKTHITMLPVTVELELKEDGVDLTVESESVAGIYFQHIFQFESSGEFFGDGVKATDAPGVLQLREGYAVYEEDGDCIEVGPGERKHLDVIPRNDKVDPKLVRLTVNSVTPLRQTLTVRCYEREGGARG